eukprot:Pgem_evm2s6056
MYSVNERKRIDYHHQKENKDKDHRWYMPDFNYTFTREFEVKTKENTTIKLKATFIAIDTTPIAHEDFRHIAGANGRSSISEKEADERFQWIEDQLKTASTTADWLFVMGHHPVFTPGTHCPNEILIKRLLPMLQKYNVSTYFAGHDHMLSHVIPIDPSTIN